MIICVDLPTKTERRFDRDGRTIEAIVIEAAKQCYESYGEFLRQDASIVLDVYDTDFSESHWRLTVRRELQYRVEGLRGQTTYIESTIP